MSQDSELTSVMQTSRLQSSIPTRINEAKSVTLKNKKATTTHPKQFGTNQVSQRLPVRSERRTLQDENSRLQSELVEQKKIMDRIKDKLHQTQKNLSEVQKLSKEKENSLQGQIQVLTVRNDNLDGKLSSYEKKMITRSIDPVSLLPFELNEDQRKNCDDKREAAKIYAKNLKEKIVGLNKDAAGLLSEMQKLGKEIDLIGIDDIKWTDVNIIENSNEKGGRCSYPLF